MVHKCGSCTAPVSFECSNNAICIYCGSKNEFTITQTPKISDPPETAQPRKPKGSKPFHYFIICTVIFLAVLLAPLILRKLKTLRQSQT